MNNEKLAVQALKAKDAYIKRQNTKIENSKSIINDLHKKIDELEKQLTDNDQVDSDYGLQFDNAADLIKHLKDQGER